MRHLLARVPKSAQAMVAATARTLFQQPDRAMAQAQLRQVVETLGSRFPKVAELLTTAQEEVFTFSNFPPEQWRQIASTNPLERLNKELKRRSAAVGIFPNRAVVIRLLEAVLAEPNDEWLVGRHYFSETSRRKLTRATPGAGTGVESPPSDRPALPRRADAVTEAAGGEGDSSADLPPSPLVRRRLNTSGHGGHFHHLTGH